MSVALSNTAASARRAAVRDHGEERIVEVLAAAPTGMRINKRRVFALRLRLPTGEVVSLQSTVPGVWEAPLPLPATLVVRTHPVTHNPVVLVGLGDTPALASG